MISLDTYKSGQYEDVYQYKAFIPTFVNDSWTWESPELSALLERAAVSLGGLNAYAKQVPNVDLFIKSHITKEAVVSSRIEGTITNMEDAVLPEEEVKPERRDDRREVLNYVKALNMAIGELATLPVSSRLLQHTHKILMQGVRGEHKQPGAYRSRQNWIGGNSLADAVFIPPAQHRISSLMGDLENFIHNDRIHIPHLMRIAIAHYQFETIHPFLDGNGRIGRLMIPLYLMSKGILDKPLLYISSYFEKNKSLYYDNLTRVRTHHDMMQWIKYFLVGIEQTAMGATETLVQILRLKMVTEETIQSQFGRRSATGIQLLHFLFEQPIINVEWAAETCGVTYKPANALVSLMVQNNILKEITGQNRNRWFVFEPYLRLFRDG